MNNLIERLNNTIAAVTDRRHRGNGRKPRKDSILGGLPPEQRSKVDKWLFDKGMTYQQVAEGCGKMFGVKVGKSSVGRYFQSVSKVQSPRTSASSVEPSKVGESGVSGSVGRCVSEEEMPGTAEECYERLMARVRQMAWLEANLPAELRDVKFFCRLVRVLIAARREKNRAILAAVERKKFELRTARSVFRHLRHTGVFRRNQAVPPVVCAESEFGAPVIVADCARPGNLRIFDLVSGAGGPSLVSSNNSIQWTAYDKF